MYRNTNCFHLAIPCGDLETAKKFYSETLGCRLDNSAQEWADVDFWGNELTLHASIMYADKITGSMQRAMDEMSRRRDIQVKFNKDNSITPTTIVKDIKDVMEGARVTKQAKKTKPKCRQGHILQLNQSELLHLIMYLKP